MGCPVDIDTLSEIARQAGAAIMDVFHSDDWGVETKDDNSPLTRADQASHDVIAAGLSKSDGVTPVLSEEGRSISLDERKGWNCFWCVDPLDGTKEFIRREKDFTVNIAFVEGGLPTAGVVYAPARDWLYAGVRGQEAWKIAEGKRQTLPLSQVGREGLIAVRSKSHPQPEEQVLLDALGVTETVSMGSSLKLCLVAEGAADVYFRAGPTWEWDTAAAHAVVAASGASVLCGKQELMYNKPSLKNDDGFLVLRDRSLLSRLPKPETAE